MQKTITLFIALLFSSSLLAASVGDLKSQGVIGELPNGYIGIVSSSASADTKNLVANINAKRKAIYQKQAAKNDIALSEVQKIAAKRNFSKTRAGNYIKLNGSWVKK